jgi:hypothetical protein
VDDVIILKLSKRNMVCGLDSSDSGYGPVADSVNTVMNLEFRKRRGIS